VPVFACGTESPSVFADPPPDDCETGVPGNGAG